MTVKVKDLLLILAITGLLLFGLEKGSGYILEKRHERTARAFLRQFSGKDLGLLNDCCSYRETDPLLGWAMTKEQLEAKGWKLTNNCIRLEHVEPGAKDTLVIFVTGGSTSDLGMDPGNWPIRLFEKLKARRQSFILYDGAVAAYGSSQEVLKLLRDGLPLKPDIHISYNGANEYQNPYFVSPHEQAFYRQALFAAQAGPVLPKTIFLLRELLGLDKSTMVLKAYPVSDGVESWKRNMATMETLARGNDYRFIALLQPVVGIGQVRDTKHDPNVQPVLQEYQHFYPGALEHARQAPYIGDLTHLFDDVGDRAFRDDCHILPEYQERVADTVLQVLIRAGVLSDSTTAEH